MLLNVLLTSTLDEGQWLVSSPGHLTPWEMTLGNY
jgi:hypothetical protein